MNDIEKHKIRKQGDYTPEDVIEQSSKHLNEVEDVIVIFRDKEGAIHRINTPMTNIELVGLLELTKMYELMDE